MATVYGDNYTKAVVSPAASTMLPAAKWNGKVRVQVDNYEAVSLVSGSTLYIGALPAYSILLGLTNICADALGSPVALALGIVGSTVKFMAATVFNTAKKRAFIDVDAGLHYQPTSDTPVIITTSGAVANGTIKTELYFAME